MNGDQYEQFTIRSTISINVYFYSIIYNNQNGIHFMSNIHFSSKSNEWTTPQDYFNILNKEFNFTLDPCCTNKSAKCDKFYTLEDDGLSKDWSNEIVFMNPPYGREIKHWIKKAYEESLKGAIVVCLVPARTDTTYWHEYCMKGKIRFIKGRLKFSGKDAAPFPSALVVFSQKEII